MITKNMMAIDLTSDNFLKQIIFAQFLLLPRNMTLDLQ